MNRYLIAGNWKMNKTIAEAKEFVEAIKSESFEENVELSILAPFTLLQSIGESIEGCSISFGAQNVNENEFGAYTGEISVSMLKEFDVKYCIVGHSERRQYYNETDMTVNAKLKALVNAEIIPILCVGEPLEVRKAEAQCAHVGGQIFAALQGLTVEQAAKIVIAYEPIWAIGTGMTATAEQAQEMCAFIRGMISGVYDLAVAKNMPLLYGGSMKPENALEILSKEDVDGGLIGGASLDPCSFVQLGRIAEQLLPIN